MRKPRKKAPKARKKGLEGLADSVRKMGRSFSKMVETRKGTSLPNTSRHDGNAAIWAACIIFSITIAGAFVYMVFPYHYSGELDCEADLGDLGLEYEQRYREEHPVVTRVENERTTYHEDGTATTTPEKRTTYKDTNQTEFRQIPIKLDIDGISGVKLRCKGKLAGTFPLSLLSRMG